MTKQPSGTPILIHGLSMILFGLILGFVVPAAAFPRLLLGAHIQFETNGMLFALLAGLMIAVPNSAGAGTFRTVTLAAWGTWLMAFSEVANAWWGTTQMLPIAAAQAGARGGQGWQELVVKLCHIVAAAGLVISVGLLIAAFARSGREIIPDAVQR